jgi:hypothetical protein
MGISSAGIRKQEDGNTGKPSRGGTEIERPSVAKVSKHHPVNGHAEEGDDPRMVTSHLPFKSAEAGVVFCRTQFVNADSASADDIGQPELPFRQTPILIVGERLIDQAGFEKEFPETVRSPRKMMSDGSRFHARIDADKQDAHSRANLI